MGALQPKNQWMKKAKLRYAKKSCFVQLFRKTDDTGERLYLDPLYPWEESIRFQATDEPIVFNGFTVFHKSKYLDHAEFTDDQNLMITPGQWIDVSMMFSLPLLDGIDISE